MARTQTQLAVRMTADGRAVVAETKKVGDQMKRLNTQVNTLNRQARAMNSTMAGLRKTMSGLGGVLVTAFGVTAIKNTLQYADELAKVSRRANVSAETLQGLQYAAESLDIPVGQINAGLIKLQANMADLKLSTNALKLALPDLGEGLYETFQQAKSNEEIFELWLATLKEMDDEVQQLALTNALFGKKGGASFFQIYKEGNGDIQVFINRLREMGGLISNEVIAKAEPANQAFTDMTTTIKTAAVNITVQLAPALTALAEGLSLIAQAAGAAIEGVEGLARTIAETAQGTDSEFSGLSDAKLQETIAQTYQHFNQFREQLQPGSIVFDEFRDILTELQTELDYRAIPLTLTASLDFVVPDKLPERKKRQIQEQVDDAVSEGGGASTPTPSDGVLPTLSKGESLIGNSLVKLRRQISALVEARNDELQRQQEINKRQQDIIDKAKETNTQLRVYYETIHEGQLEQEELIQRAAELRAEQHERHYQQIKKENEELEEQRRKIEDIAETYGGRFVDAMLSGANAADTLRSILADVLNQLIRQLIVTQLVAAVTSAFGGGTGVSGDLDPALHGGHIFPGVATGGRIARSGLVRVGEAGPELVALPKGAEVYPRGDLSDKGRGNTIINVEGVQDPVAVENALRRASADIEQNILGKILRDRNRPGVGRAYA